MMSELGAGRYVLPARPDFCWQVVLGKSLLSNHYSPNDIRYSHLHSITMGRHYSVFKIIIPVPQYLRG